MPNYGINLTYNNDGTYTITNVYRAPTTNASGGTDIAANNTVTTNTATGALLTASGFQDSASTTTDGLGHKLRSPMEALERCNAMIRNDRSFNGD
jgi:hypothetical protein